MLVYPEKKERRFARDFQGKKYVFDFHFKILELMKEFEVVIDNQNVTIGVNVPELASSLFDNEAITLLHRLES